MATRPSPTRWSVLGVFTMLAGGARIAASRGSPWRCAHNSTMGNPQSVEIREVIVPAESGGGYEPQPCWLNKTSVFQLAKSFAKSLGYKFDGDVRPLVARLGGKIEEKNFFGNNMAESLEVRSPDDFTIFVPIDTSEVRNTFTILHELGHYVLHTLWAQRQGQNVKYPIRFTRLGSTRIEWEANWFASGFLMPEEEFREAFSQNNGHPLALADRFGVSAQAALVRAQGLGLTS